MKIFYTAVKVVSGGRYRGLNPLSSQVKKKVEQFYYYSIIVVTDTHTHTHTRGLRGTL